MSQYSAKTRLINKYFTFFFLKIASWFDNNPKTALFLFSFIPRFILIVAFPAIWGSDTVARLFYRDQIIIAHWLPACQFVVWGVMSLFKSILVLQVCFALIGSLVVVSFYYFMMTISTKRDAIIASIFLSLTPLVFCLSTVPYQESILGLSILLSFLCFKKDYILCSALFFGIACLTRYEAWIFSIFWIYLYIKKYSYINDKITMLYKYISIPIFSWGIVIIFIINHYLYDDPLYFIHRSVFENNVSQNNFNYLESISNGLIWYFKYGGIAVLLALFGIISDGKRIIQENIIAKCFLWWILFLYFVFPIFLPDFVYRYIYLHLILYCTFIPFGINLLTKYIGHKKQIVLISLTILTLHTAGFFYSLHNRPFVIESYNTASVVNTQLSISINQKALVLAEGFEYNRDIHPNFYTAMIGQTTCGQKCFENAYSTGINNTLELKQFIITNKIKYFISYKDFQGFNEEGLVYQNYITDEKLTLIYQQGDIAIYEIAI